MQLSRATGVVRSAMPWGPVFGCPSSDDGVVLTTDKVLPIDASSYNVGVAYKDDASSHPKVAQRFVKALSDGVPCTSSHPQQALRLMAEQAGVTLAAAKLHDEGFQPAALPSNMAQYIDSTYAANALGGS